MIGLLVILALTALAPAAQAQVVQTTNGWCSPAFSNVTGSVVINCTGLDPKSLALLNELLEREKLNLAAKIRQGEDWTRQYVELKDQLEKLGKIDNSAQQAETQLQAGDLDHAGATLDRLNATYWLQPDLSARIYAARAAVFALELNYGSASDCYQKALRGRPDDDEILTAAAFSPISAATILRPNRF